MSEESEKVERTKMRYPKGRMIVVRDSTVPVCNNNNPGAVLLSVLLFWYDNPHKFDTYDDKEQTFTLCRTQAEIEEQACHQIDVKTIHRTAVPLLQLFGYLTVHEKMNGNLYILHMDRIFAAYAAYEQGASALKNFLKTSLQLDSCPIKIPESQLDSCLINRTPLYLQLDSVLIRNRQESNCKRGRKPKTQEDLEAISEETENLREYRENSNEREREGEQEANATIASSLSFDAALSLDNDTQSQFLIANSNTPQQGDIHGTILPSGHPDLYRALEFHHAPDTVPDTSGDPHRTADTQQPEVDEEWCNAETEHRLPAIPKPASPAMDTSHEQNRDATSGNVAVEVDSGCTTPAPTPQAPPGVTPPRTIKATVIAPPPQVLVVSMQFTSVEDWKQAQDAFVETLRGFWKTAAPAFKRQAGNWNIYRKQYLDRWLQANPDPSQVQFTPDGKILFDEWCSLFKVTVDPIRANIEAANWLAERCTTWATLLNMERREVLRDFKDWCYTNDKKGYYTRGVKLFDLKREFEGWQSYQQSLLDKAEREKARPQNKYGTVSGLPRLEPSQEWLEAMGGR